MPQMFFPIFAEGVVQINANLAYKKQDGRIYYFNGHQIPLFSHDKDDVQSFRMITSQFYVNGNATQAQIIRTFGIPSITMKRAVHTFRTKGPAGFYVSERLKRKPRVLTPEIVINAQNLIDEGLTLGDIALKLGLKADTLQKAVRDGRLKKKFPPQSQTPQQKVEEA